VPSSEPQDAAPSTRRAAATMAAGRRRAVAVGGNGVLRSGSP
jgi:hypothetical protein